MVSKAKRGDKIVFRENILQALLTHHKVFKTFLAGCFLELVSISARVKRICCHIRRSETGEGRRPGEDGK